MPTQTRPFLLVLAVVVPAAPLPVSAEPRGPGLTGQMPNPCTGFSLETPRMHLER